MWGPWRVEGGRKVDRKPKMAAITRLLWARATAISIVSTAAARQCRTEGSELPVSREKDPNLQYASSCVLPTTWTKCKLLRVTPYNHDTSIFDFEVRIDSECFRFSYGYV